MSLIKKELSAKVLTIGPDYRNHRGGIGAVLSVYALFYETFNFIPTYKYHKNNSAKSLFYMKQLLLLAKTLMVSRKIKIVHIHGSHRGSFYRKFFLFLISKKLFGKKVIYHMHSDDFDTFYYNSKGIHRKLIRYFINSTDVLICLAPYWEKFFSKNFNINNIRIVNNVILPLEKIRNIPENEYAINLVFLGRIGRRKGIFDIIEVLRKNKSQFLGKLKLYVGGDGEKEKLKELIKEYQLENIVEYVGWIQGEKKIELLSKAQAYILPSYSEGLPISILEAMSFKLPIISTSVGGIPELVESDVNGLLVNPGNHSEILSAMLFFINNPSKAAEFGKVSYEKVKSYFPDRVFAQLEEIYEVLIPSPDKKPILLSKKTA